MSFARPLVFPVYHDTWTADDRREWVEQVRQRYGLVTVDGGLPRQPCGMTADGQYEGWHRTGGVCGRVDSPERWVRSGDRRAWDGLTDWQILGLLNEMSCRQAEYYEPRNAELRARIAWRRDASPEEFRRLRESRWPDHLPEGSIVTQGRQHESGEVHPPEWRPE